MWVIAQETHTQNKQRQNTRGPETETTVGELEGLRLSGSYGEKQEQGPHLSPI